MNWNEELSNLEYLIPYWGEDYFSANAEGYLSTHPFRDERSINFKHIIKELKQRNISYPCVLRFHDILIDRVKSLYQHFINSMEELDYKGYYYCAYPIKVNQMKEVVEEITEAGKKYFIGLEAGSKAELMAILSFDLTDNAICILNGHKDRDYLKLALLGTKMGKKMVIVIEQLSELDELIKISKELEISPTIGFRAKLDTKSEGPWAESSGPNAKFGLSVREIVCLVKTLEKNDMLDCLELLHFHIGSQIPTLGAIKDASCEAVRTYCNLKKAGLENLRYLDIGGGLAINYEGVIAQNEDSLQYRPEDYIKTVVKTIKEICDEEQVNHPDIVSESGRFITAHHSCILTNVLGTTESKELKESKRDLNLSDKSKSVLKLKSLLTDLNNENYRDTYLRTQNIKNDSFENFKAGKVTLWEYSKVSSISEKIIKEVLSLDITTTVYKNFKETISSQNITQYVCNFSVFQSIPDSWAINQVLPTLPIQRLNERPNIKSTLVDITCDSDGKIKKYASQNGVRDYMHLHQLDENEYVIGIFLTGAYQDIMGDMHNLYGRLNEAHIYHDKNETENFYIEEVIYGQSSGKVLSTLQYTAESLASNVKKKIDKQVKRGIIRPRQGVSWVDYYESLLDDYTYLK